MIINNDFRNVLPSIKEANSDKNIIIVSDPPFNIGYKYNSYKDRISEKEYDKLIISAFSEFPAVIIHYPEMLYRISKLIDKLPNRVVSWIYNSNTARQHRDIAFFDVIPNFKNLVQPYKNPNDKRIKKLIESGKMGGALYDWWNINQVKNVSKEKTEHTCQMPLKVMENIIGILPKDALIIDPFCGSGTTGVACAKLGVDFIGIEIDSKYADIARKRIEQI